MLLWVILTATVVAAYDLHYVNRTDTFTVLDLPPAGSGTYYQYSNGQLRATGTDKSFPPGFQIQLFLTSLCFKGEYFEGTAPTAAFAPAYANYGKSSGIRTSLNLNMTTSNTSYWCTPTTLDPDFYLVTINGLQWWESVTVMFPVPAPENAAPDDILQQRLSFLHEEQDQFVADDALVIPHGSFLKTGTVLNNSQRMVSNWIVPNSTLILMVPEGTAFFVLYANTSPGASPHWLASCNYTFSTAPPWFPDIDPNQLLFTKGSSVVDIPEAAVLMGPLDPSVRSNLTLTYNRDNRPHNFTHAVFYSVHVDPSRNATNTTAATTSTVSTTDGTALSVSAAGAKSSTGAITGAVVGGVVGLAAIVGIAVFLVRRKRREEQEQRRREKDESKFVIEDNVPSLLPTPLDPPFSHKSTALPPAFLKDEPSWGSQEPQPFSKPHSTTYSSSGASAAASSSTETRPAPPSGPRFRNDIDAGVLERAESEDEGGDAESDTGTVLMPPTYDPRWKSSARSREPDV